MVSHLGSTMILPHYSDAPTSYQTEDCVRSILKICLFSFFSLCCILNGSCLKESFMWAPRCLWRGIRSRFRVSHILLLTQSHLLLLDWFLVVSFSFQMLYDDSFLLSAMVNNIIVHDCFLLLPVHTITFF